ncbi:hypothetical protein C6P45_002095 [Maudiozyma exigua]|uniref:Ketopantoate reductase C-terminal domain-containing protein n=1 Tax=Maudiozyma exigua TaxID=34358 RepID=A0A9P7B557_MAUEX|nr:hypothetical protein C6P45_002095 [Kazachstania exigua]
MSSLKVLTLGNNPNILLYTSRFQLANSVDLYHISNSTTNIFEIETHTYGTERLVLQNHYKSIADLTETNNEKLIFDVVILGASSLQELSSISNDLTDYINSSTKIFIESTGFVQLESFVKMSMNVSQLNIFSIVTDFDIREISNNKFKQFRTSDLDNTNNTIYLGDSSVKGSEYSTSMLNLLKTFERLFQKLFPRDKIDLCNGNPSRFLTTQWNIAIPIICFDPLLILLEETEPQHLKDQILAKPLISGLVSEVIKITKSMNLNVTWDNEKDLLKHWGESYSIHNSMPSLLYHFIHKTAPLNFDITLLQIILLADDFNLKTPYLEFLYSIMIQIQKLNDNRSKWFIRSESANKSSNELDQLTEQNNLNLSKIESLNGSLRDKDDKIQTLENSEKLQKSSLENSQQPSSNPSLQNNQLQNVKQQEYKNSGTPIMHDLQDFAGYGVNYGDSPATQRNQSPSIQSVSNYVESNNNLSNTVNQHSESRSTNGSDTSLKERELELRKKELELQERELDMQRKAMQLQMQRMPNSQPQQQQQMNGGSRQPSYANIQQQQQMNMPQQQGMQMVTVVQAEYPIASNMGYNNNSNNNNYPQQMNSNQQFQPHGFKTTSRKNRNSNMPMLGSASSAPGTAGNFGTYNRPQHGSASQPNLNQSRIGSMTSQNVLAAGQLRNRPGQNAGPYANHQQQPRNNGPMSVMNSTSSASLQQQRQASGMSMSNNNINDPNTTSNTVIHNVQPAANTNNVAGVKQTYAPVSLSSPSVTNPPKMSISESGTMQSPVIPSSPDVSSTASHDEKKKKKKFGFFKKKSKK